MKLLSSLIAILLLSCSGARSIEQRIGSRVDACSTSVPCTVKLADLTDFTWDQMHVFEAGATLDDIQKSIGTNFPDYVEFTRRFVFLKNGAIVHLEDEPTNMEHPFAGQVSFAESYTNSHWSFTPANAVFRAEKKTFSGGSYYVLTQVNDGTRPNKSLDASGGSLLNCEFRISNCGFDFAPPRQLRRWATSISQQ